ncbi:MAG: DUF4173 domain-containing protein [Fimbriimonadaceae bacterium]|nr:DUF4173 domain-containing protein [Fimbriimonadaceae bacterium]
MAVSTNVGDPPATERSETRSRSALGIMLAATGMALIGQELLFDAATGFSSTLLLLLGTAITLLLLRQSLIELKRSSLWLFAPIVAAAIGLGLNDSRRLAALNVLIILFAIGLIVVIETDDGTPNILHTFVVSALYPVLFPLISLFLPFLADWKRLRPAPQSKRTSGVMLGIVAAIPVMFILGVILAQADPVFGRLFSLEWSIDPDTVVERGLLFGIVGSFTAGAWMMMSSRLRKKAFETTGMGDPPPGYTTTNPAAPPIETQKAGIDATHAISAFATFFGLIGLMFLIFILVQVRYLFGGNDVVLKTAELTYAQYARRGFFEIVTVTALSLPILLGAQSVLKSVEAAHRRLFNAVAVGMSILLLCLLASAGFRMSLYVQAYGLSPMRFYVCAGIVWLAVVIGLYMWLGVSWQLSRFGLACMAAFFAVGVSLNVIRPDSVIASVNLNRADKQNLDRDMIINAGADAWPALQAASPDLRKDWLDRFAGNKRGWKSMSLSKWRVFQTGQVPAASESKNEDTDSLF